MKTRRVLTSLLTTCALLAQSWAIAGMGPMLKTALPDQVQTQATANDAMPCHGDSADQAAPDCCDDASTCAKVCAGGTGMVSASTLPASEPTADLALAATASRALAAHTLTPLRPPILSQS